MEQNKYDAAITYEYEKNLYINMTNQCCNSCDFCLRIKESLGACEAGHPAFL